MKNREKFAKEILDIACSGRSIAVTKENKIAYCSNISCESCMFDGCGKHIGTFTGMLRSITVNGLNQNM